MAAYRARVAHDAEAVVAAAAADARAAHALRQAVRIEPIAIGRQLQIGAIVGAETGAFGAAVRTRCRPDGRTSSQRSRFVVAAVVGGVRANLAATGAAVVGGIVEFRVDENGQFVFARCERLGRDGAEVRGHGGWVGVLSEFNGNCVYGGE